MGSHLLRSKKFGARISLATLTAQIALGSLTLGLAPATALALSDTRNADDFIDVGISGGDENWSDNDDVETSNDNYSVVTLNDNEISNYNWIDDFDFAIPVGATIDGIVVQVERRAQSADKIKDYAVRLIKNGTIVGSNKADTSTFWVSSSPDTIVSYGGASDLWGTTWTRSDINDNDFGVAFSVKKDTTQGSNTDAYVDHISITVHYTEAVVDTDGDTVPDSTDNCDSVSNLDQLNNDADAEGDACDTDDDNDTVLDVTDNCDFVANLDQLDTDSDGAGNACENEAYVTIEKQTVPDGSEETFDFSGSLGEGAALSDGQNVSFSVTPDGEGEDYIYNEASTEGWTLTDIDCGESAGDTTVYLGEGDVYFDLEDDDIVTCVFTNTQDEEGPVCGNGVIEEGETCDDNDASGEDGCSSSCLVEEGYECTGQPSVCTLEEENGSITIIKQTVPDGAEDMFDFYGEGALGEGALVDFSLSDGESITQSDLEPGNYEIYEFLKEGWDLTDLQCDDEGEGEDATSVDSNGEGESAGWASISLQAGEDVTCTFTNTSDNASCSTEDEGIAFYLPFDEGEGLTANDQSIGGTMDGTLTNGPLFSTDVPTLGFSNPYSLEFDGTNDYVDLGNPSFPTPASFSVSAWVKADTIGIDRQIVSKGYNGTQTEWEMKTTSADGKVSFQTYNAGQVGVQALTPLAEDTWTHVVGTFDGTTWKLYLNGSLDNSNVAAAPIATARPIYVGAVDNQGTPVQFWDGNLDDVRFYGRALTDDEVSDLYDGDCDADDTPPASVCGNESEEEGEQCDDGNVLNGDGCSSMCQDELAACVTTDDYLVGHWEFDAGTGSVAYDATDLNNEGAVTGASWIAGVITAFYNPFALSFDGSDDIVTVSNTTDLDFGTNDAFTISAWTRASSFAGYETIFQKIDDSTGAQQGFVLTLANGVPQFWMQSDYAANEYLQVGSTTPLTVDTWHHVAVTYDGSGLASGVRIYLNGTDTTGSIGHDNLVGSIVNVGEVEIGNRNGGSFQQLSGDVDDVRVYETVLESTQVAALAAGSCDAGVTAPPDIVDADEDGIPDEEDPCVTFNLEDLDDDGLEDVCDEDIDIDDGEGGNGGNGNQSFGFSAPGLQGSRGARRGAQTNILNSLIALFGGDGEQGDVPPGGFGGPGEEEFTDEETDVICRMRKALPEDASSSVRVWVAEQLATKMPHSVEAIAEELKTGSICPQELVRSNTRAKPLAFRVDALGFPVSSNDTWNKCIRGTATLQDIRNNPDRDDDGYGVSCSRYHTNSLWRHPDLNIYFTWNGKKGVSLPVGYAIRQDSAVTQR